MKRFSRLSLRWSLAALMLVLMLALPWAALAAVWTDLQDYSPGDIVTIHGDNSDGAGYLPGETVHVDVSGPNGYAASCEAVADENGAWSCQVTLWPDYMAVGTYSYAATGQTSGVSQSGTFTDGNLRFHETGLPVGTSWSVTWNGELKSNTAPNDVVFGGSGGGPFAYTVTSPLSGGTGIQYVASPASGTATQPGSGQTTVNIAFTTQYQVSFAVNPSGGGSTSPSATAYYNAGSTISISATPATGYVFSSWSASGSITFANASSASTTATINGTGTITANFNLADSTPPATTITLGPATPNGLNGWYVTNVHVTVSAVDNPGGSGVAETRCVLDPASAPASFDAIPPGCAYTGAGADVTTEGQHVVYAASKDNAGNKESPVSKSFKIDKTKPTINAAATTAPNAAGWYNSNVTVHFTCSDALSGIPDGACPADQVLSAEGAAVASTAQTVTDAAGNTSDPSNVVTVKIDKTAPTITWNGGPAHSGSYYFGFVPAAPTCTASDLLSGPNGCTVTGYSAAVGSHTMTATAYDFAGNSKTEMRSYEVKAWEMYGFYQPVDMNGVWNTVKGGSTVPLKFEVFAGSLEFTDPSVIVQPLQASRVSCTPGTDDTIEELAAAGNTVLRYDFTDGQFIYNWKTPKSPGICYKVTVSSMSGGSPLTAYFKLK